MTTISIADGVVTMSEEEFDKLNDDAMKYNFLRNAGVDNWDGWDDAMEAYREWAGEDE